MPKLKSRANTIPAPAPVQVIAAPVVIAQKPSPPRPSTLAKADYHPAIERIWTNYEACGFKRPPLWFNKPAVAAIVCPDTHRALMSESANPITPLRPVLSAGPFSNPKNSQL